MTMLFDFDYSEQETKVSRENKKTVRSYEGVLHTNSNSFNGDGNFTQEDLIRNSGKVFAVIVETTDSDSYSKHENANFEIQEVFLTMQKAVNLYNIIKLHNDFMYNINYSRDEPKKLEEEFISTLKNVYGIDSNLEQVTKKLPYRDESDNIKTLTPNWHQFGTSESDMFVLEKNVLNYQETLDGDSSYKSVKFRKH